MTGAFERAIRTYGQKMVCHRADGSILGYGFAIVQPMTKAEWQHTAGALGGDTRDEFLCLATSETPLERVRDGGWVTCGENRYEVMTVRPIWVAGHTTHRWAVLRPERRMAP